MKYRFACLLSLSAIVGLTGCDKITSLGKNEVKCGDPAAMEMVNSLLEKQIQSEAKDIAGYQGTRVDSAGLRASISQIAFALDNIRTSKKDPQSTKNFCTATLTTKLDGELIKRANFVRDYQGQPNLSEEAFQQDLEMDANTIEYELEYAVQLTDDGKKIFVELQNGSELINFVSVAVTDAIQRNAIQALKAQEIKGDAIAASVDRQASANTEAAVLAASSEAHAQAADEIAAIAAEQAKVKATMDFKRSEFNKLWNKASKETQESMMDDQKAWVESRDQICLDRAREVSPERQEIERMECITELLSERYYEVKEYIDTYD